MSERVELVKRVLEAANAGDWETLETSLSSDAFIRPDSGGAYVGLTGLGARIAEDLERNSERRFETAEIRDLGDGYVLVLGTLFRIAKVGGPEAIPGAWLMCVRDGHLAASLYHRTEAQALAAVPANRRRRVPAEIVEAAVDAFNRLDYPAIIASVTEDHRFVSIFADPGTERRGVAAVAELLASARRDYDEFVLEGHRLTELGGGHVLVRGIVRTRVGARLTRTPGHWLARVEDGRVAEFVAYASANEARAAHEADA